jgi:hypothetical protein
VLDDITGEKDVEPFVVETFGEPAHRPPIRLSPAHRQFVRDEFKAVKDAGLAKSMHTPWASPCFPVPKPRSEKLRLVIDFRALNLRTKRSSFPIPYIRDVVLKIVDPASVEKLGCNTEEDLIVWLVLPFGPRNGPPHFQAVINKAIAED